MSKQSIVQLNAILYRLWLIIYKSDECLHKKCHYILVLSDNIYSHSFYITALLLLKGTLNLSAEPFIAICVVVLKIPSS